MWHARRGPLAQWLERSAHISQSCSGGVLSPWEWDTEWSLVRIRQGPLVLRTTVSSDEHCLRIRTLPRASEASELPPVRIRQGPSTVCTILSQRYRRPQTLQRRSYHLIVVSAGHSLLEFNRALYAGRFRRGFSDIRRAVST